MRIQELKAKSVADLLNIASSFSIENADTMKKHDLITSILKKYIESGESITSEGVVEILPEGFAFLRSAKANYMPTPEDVYIPIQSVKKFGLRTGDIIECSIKLPKENEKYVALQKILQLNFHDQKSSSSKTNFDSLVPLFPDKRIILEDPDAVPGSNADMTLRVIDLITPIGFGQRALIVAPPRTGKTVIMQKIAKSISKNYPDTVLMILLIDERPEEVTDMARSVVEAEVISSTFDEAATKHIHVAEMVIGKAKRLVEIGKDVVILLDSITRLARAYNSVIPSSGKVLTGGVDSNALQKPKKFFGAARNIENGGSLTIIGTALVETGSRMDDVIFEEFKGTGNLEINLDRKISDKRIFPAIDISRSGTRKEELLVEKSILSKMWLLRRVLNPMGPTEGMDFLLEKLRQTKNNADFFNTMNSI